MVFCTHLVWSGLVWSGLVPCHLMASRKQKDTANYLSWYAECDGGDCRTAPATPGLLKKLAVHSP